MTEAYLQFTYILSFTGTFSGLEIFPLTHHTDPFRISRHSNHKGSPLLFFLYTFSDFLY